MCGEDGGPGRVFPFRQAERERQRRSRVEPGIDRTQLLKAAHHESGRDEQDQCKRHLAGHQQAACLVAAPARGVGAPGITQRAGRRRAAEQRHRTEHDPREETQCDRKRDDDAVDTNFAETRQRTGTEIDQQPDADPGEPDAKYAAARRHQQTLAEKEPGDRRIAGAERPANRELALPHLGADQEQVGDVRACDQQHHANRGEQRPEGARNGPGHRFLERRRC